MTRSLRAVAEVVLAASTIVATPVAATLLLGWHARRPARDRWMHRVLHARWLLVATVGGIVLTVAAVATDGLTEAAGAVAVPTALFLLTGMVIVRSAAPPVATGLGRAFVIAVVMTLTIVTAASAAIAFSTGERVAAWTTHPNVWGAHLAAGLAVALGLVLGERRTTVAAIGVLGVMAVAATGSRTATLAVIAAVIVAVAFAGRSGRVRAPRRAIVAGVTMALLVSAVVLSTMPLGARLDLIGFGTAGAEPTNRFAASEELTSALWTARDVTVERLADDRGVAVHQVRSRTPDGLARLHQRVVIPAGTAAIVSVELGPEGLDAGLLAFGEPSGRLSIRRDGTVLARPSDLDVTSVSVSTLDDGWTRLTVNLTALTEESRIWRVGFAPSLSRGHTDVVRIRRPSIVWGNEPLPYVGTTVRDREAARARASAAQRLEYVPAAIAIASRSWLVGHGRERTFAELADAYAPGRLGASDRPTHAHSLLLDLLVTNGVLGVVGFGLMGAAWWMAVPRASRPAAAPLIVALVLANVGDATLFTGGPEFALLAFLMLHAGGTKRA